MFLDIAKPVVEQAKQDPVLRTTESGRVKNSKYQIRKNTERRRRQNDKIQVPTKTEKKRSRNDKIRNPTSTVNGLKNKKYGFGHDSHRTHVFIATLLFDHSMSAPRRSRRPGARQTRSGDRQPARERGQQTQGGPLGGGAHFSHKAARPKARQPGSGDGQPEREESQAQTQGEA